MDPMDLERRANAMAAYFELLPIEGGAPEFQVNRELQPFIIEHKLPFHLFAELV